MQVRRVHVQAHRDREETDLAADHLLAQPGAIVGADGIDEALAVAEVKHDLLAVLPRITHGLERLLDARLHVGGAHGDFLFQVAHGGVEVLGRVLGRLQTAGEVLDRGVDGEDGEAIAVLGVLAEVFDDLGRKGQLALRHAGGGAEEDDVIARPGVGRLQGRLELQGEERGAVFGLVGNERPLQELGSVQLGENVLVARSVIDELLAGIDRFRRFA